MGQQNSASQEQGVIEYVVDKRKKSYINSLLVPSICNLESSSSNKAKQSKLASLFFSLHHRIPKPPHNSQVYIPRLPSYNQLQPNNPHSSKPPSKWLSLIPWSALSPTALAPSRRAATAALAAPLAALTASSSMPLSPRKSSPPTPPRSIWILVLAATSLRRSGRLDSRGSMLSLEFTNIEYKRVRC